MMPAQEFDEICQNTQRLIYGLKWTFATVLLVAVVLLSGCATPSNGLQMCGMKPVGHNESGVMFVLMQCEAHE